MLRKVYYSIPSSWRFWVRRIVFLPEDLFSKKSSLIPPKGLIYTGRGDFIGQGNKYVSLFKEHGDLQSDATFLDIGSGIGRVGIPLTQHLSHKAEYHGFDVIELGVSWCKKNITAKFPNFKFSYVPLLNDLYRNNGEDAANYKFPYPSNHFDFACSVSVFTHMLPREVANYFNELEKVMKPGGKIFATFFILNELNSNLMASSKGFNFNHKLDGYYLMDANVKGANVAFEEEYLLNEIIKSNRFKVVTKSYGHWCGRDESESFDFQDVYIIEKL
ncbi:MAG: SAM-dependent methyltransferase [Salibacteraceae bacterium]|jgi:SAM-dependent methyltransferase